MTDKDGQTKTNKWSRLTGNSLSEQTRSSGIVSGPRRTLPGASGKRSSPGGSGRGTKESDRMGRESERGSLVSNSLNT